MKKLIFSIIFNFIFLSVYSQSDTINQLDKNGLKIGYWKYNLGDKHYPSYHEGYFKVIPIDTTINYSKDIFIGNLWSHYEYRIPQLEYSGKNKRFISVPDGKWIEYSKITKGKKIIEWIRYFKNGYEYRNEQLQMYPNSSFFKKIENTSFKDSLKTIDIEVDSLRLIFKRYIIGDKCTTIFYPTSDVHVENAEFDYVNTLFTKPDTLYINLTAKDTLLIKAINSNNNELSFIDNFTSTTKFLLPGQMDSIGLVFKPDRNKDDNKAVVTLKVNNDYLNFYFDLAGFDISRKNIADVKSIHLRKSDNLILYIEHMFMHNYGALFKNPIKESDKHLAYNCKGIVRCWHSTDMRSSGPMNLSKLKAGTYYLTILGGNIDRIKIEIIIEEN